MIAPSRKCISFWTRKSLSDYWRLRTLFLWIKGTLSSWSVWTLAPIECHARQFSAIEISLWHKKGSRLKLICCSCTKNNTKSCSTKKQRKHQSHLINRISRKSKRQPKSKSHQFSTWKKVCNNQSVSSPTSQKRTKHQATNKLIKRFLSLKTHSKT